MTWAHLNIKEHMQIKGDTVSCELPHSFSPLPISQKGKMKHENKEEPLCEKYIPLF